MMLFDFSYQLRGPRVTPSLLWPSQAHSVLNDLGHKKQERLRCLRQWGPAHGDQEST